MKIKWNIIIAIFEIAGGIIGIVITTISIPLIFSNRQDNQFSRWLFLILCSESFGVINLAAGFYLWKRKLSGIYLSLFAQLIQIPNFVIGGFHYIAFAGIKFNLGLQFFNEQVALNFDFGAGSNFGFGPVSVSGYSLVAVNIVPIILFIYLNKNKHKILSPQEESVEESPHVEELPSIEGLESLEN